MNTKILIVKCFSLLVITAMLLSGCEKGDSLDQDKLAGSAEIEKLSISEKNEMIESYAFILASSIGNKEFRSMIKKEAQLMFDGDYDILIKKLDYMWLPTQHMQVKELLVSSVNNNNLKSISSCPGNVPDDGFFERVQKTVPNLQVSVPVHCDEWDTENYIPLVAYLPLDYDESTTQYITAFDIYGKRYELSLDVEPENPVIVVGISERIDENGEKIGTEAEYYEVQPSGLIKPEGLLKSTPTGPSDLIISHGPARSIILQWSDVKDETAYEVWRMHQPDETQFLKLATTSQNDNGYVNNCTTVGAKVWYKVRATNDDGFSSWSPIMATTVSARNDGEWLKIKRMKFSKSALKAVENWVSGAPELRLRVVKGSETGASIVYTSGRMEPRRRNDIQDEWWNNEVQIFTWHTNTYGTVLTFDWQEEDNISKYDFTVNASYEAKELGGKIKAGGSVKFTVDKNGSIGNTSVMWWHDKGQIYDLSGFQWQFVY